MRWLSPAEIDELAEVERSKRCDHVIRYQTGWYFWDEVQTGCFGPFATELLAVKALELYAETI